MVLTKNRQKNIQKVNLNLNKQLTVRTAHECVHIAVHSCSTQYSAEQF